MKTHLSAIVLTLGLTTCSGDAGTNPFESASTTASTTGTGATLTGSGPTSQGSVSASGSASASATSTSGTGAKFDVGNGNTEGASDSIGGESCTSVDILFVIDNSPSMGKYQEQLAFAFPTFVDAMWQNLPADTDLHVGVTTSSFFSGSCSESTLQCATAQTPQEVLAHYMTPDQGSTGVNGEQGRLFEHDGMKYFATTVGGDPWPLKIWFSGAATAAGESGCSYEMLTAGGSYPFHDANAANNTGFVRDAGSVLVIFFLTDEPDKSPEPLADYKAMVTAAKTDCGGEDCVVVAGLVNECIMGVNNILWQFLNDFPDPPQVGSIDDAAGYQTIIGSALAEIIGQKCDEIPPVG